MKALESSDGRFEAFPDPLNNRVPVAVERRTWRDADADLGAVVDAD